MVQGDLLSLDGVIALHALGLLSEYYLLKVWAGPAATWIALFGNHRGIQMDGGGE